MPSASVVSKVRLVCKGLELILACVCIALYVNGSIPLNKHVHVLLPLTFGGYIIIVAGLLLGFVTGEKVPKTVDLLYTFTGVALFIAAGSLYIHSTNNIPYFPSHRTTKTIDLATGSISIINGGVFMVDMLLTYKDVNEYTPH